MGIYGFRLLLLEKREEDVDAPPIGLDIGTFICCIGAAICTDGAERTPMICPPPPPKTHILPE